MNPEVFTHKAYALRRKRVGKTLWVKWKDVGDAVFEIADLPDHLKHLAPYLPELLKLLRCHLDLDATPIGGFDGGVRVVPPDVNPKDAAPRHEQPERPGAQETDATTDATDEDL
jgi:hypothetical protein